MKGFLFLLFFCKKLSTFQSDTTLAVLVSSLNDPSYSSVNEWNWRSYVGVTILYFSGALVKLRKATVCFVLSVFPPVCPSVLMEQTLLPLDEFSEKIYVCVFFIKSVEKIQVWLTFWRRNYLFLILAHPVYKMWIIREPNMLELWNKLYFEGEKTESICHV